METMRQDNDILRPREHFINFCKLLNKNVNFEKHTHKKKIHYTIRSYKIRARVKNRRTIAKRERRL